MTGRRLVTVEAGEAVVRKSFLDEDAETALALARCEFERLQRCRSVLDGREGIDCPRPMELLAGPPPTIRMARVSGRPLLEVLRSGPVPPDLRRRLPILAADIVTGYVDAVAEPYLDFQFDNLLYDAGSATLAFVDVGAPDGGTAVAPAGSPMDVSLGNLIGSTIFQSARPKWLPARRQHARAVELCSAVVAEVAERRPSEVSVTGIREHARSAYERSAFRGRRHKLWYGSVGYLLARRVEVLGVTFSPSPHHPRPRTSTSGRTKRK